MENGMETVTVTYSAEEQKEMKAIRARYMPEEKKTLTDLEKARAIDARVERKGLRAGVLLGIAGVVMAWPVYQKVVRKERSRAADEIMRLTAEE